MKITKRKYNHTNSEKNGTCSHIQAIIHAIIQKYSNILNAAQKLKMQACPS
jgi:hypothetical protein